MSISPSSFPTESPLKILVIDDHALVREGLRLLLQGLTDSVTVFDTSSVPEALELTQENPDLDLVLLDYLLPDMDGREALQLISQSHPELPILVLSGAMDPVLGRELMNLGASGFVTKSANSDELLQAIAIVLNGGEFISKTQNGAQGSAADWPKLTARQEDVLELLMHGYSNKVISRHLNLSEETTKNHITAILRAFGVSNRTQVVAAARRIGYISRPPI
ncbi:MAG: response regulator transcription factor [Hylemonella sp.]